MLTQALQFVDANLMPTALLACPEPVTPGVDYILHANQERIVAKKMQTRRVTELRLRCGHVLMAINPIADFHVCYFCSFPKDKGLMTLERRWTGAIIDN
jgi:hypothetical protein